MWPLGLLVVVLLSPETAARDQKQPMIGEPAPAFSLKSLDGKIATRYAPAGAQPDLPRDQVPIASNLVLDRSGKIRFFSLLDTANFDAKLLALTVRLDALLTEK